MDAVCVRPTRGAWDRDIRVGSGCGCSDTLAVNLTDTDGRKRAVTFIIAVNLTSQATHRLDSRSGPTRLSAARPISTDARIRKPTMGRIGHLFFAILDNSRICKPWRSKNVVLPYRKLHAKGAGSHGQEPEQSS